MIYQVNHTSRVRYGAPVDLARFAIRLKPASWPGQTLLSYHMDVSPVPTHLAEEFGPYQVNNTLVSIDERLQELVVTSVFRMEVTPPPGIVDDGTDIATVRSAALRVGDIATFAPAPFLYGSRVVELESEIGAWAASMLGDTAGIVPAIRALCSKIHAEFTYLPGVTDSDTPPLEAFRARHGVCQDFAHVMIAALRWYGIPAAYVSGYLRTEPPPGRPRLVGADAMHAWVNVWCGPRLGWVAIDPTNDRMVDQDYVTVAMGRDYADIAPVDGVFVGTPVQKMTTGVDVIPEA